MTEVTHGLGKGVRVDRLLIRHHWVGVHQPDAVHARNAAFFNQDRATFEARQRRGFRAGSHEDALVARLAGVRWFEYVREGHDRRALELRADRTIGLGAARLERRWDLVRATPASAPELLISGDAGIICRLREDRAGVWRGRWTAFEQMPISLHPRAPQTLEHATARVRALRFFDYIRVGHDQRLLELCPDGSVGRGRARLEASWAVVPDPQADAALVLRGDAGVICRLRLEPDGCWRGQWTQFERMPIVLAPRTAAVI
jgi:hypothetical protein